MMSTTLNDDMEKECPLRHVRSAITLTVYIQHFSVGPRCRGGGDKKEIKGINTGQRKQNSNIEEHIIIYIGNKK